MGPGGGEEMGCWPRGGSCGEMAGGGEGREEGKPSPTTIGLRSVTMLGGKLVSRALLTWREESTVNHCSRQQRW